MEDKKLDIASSPQENQDFGRGKKVLIVDDDASTIELLRGILVKVGFEIVVARDGEEGLAKARSDRPHLIIADIVMPKVDGYVFIKELKKNEDTKDLSILVLTVRKNMEDAFLALGIDGFLVKPIDGERLLAVISKLTLRAAKEKPIEQPPQTEEKK